MRIAFNALVYRQDNYTPIGGYCDMWHCSPYLPCVFCIWAGRVVCSNLLVAAYLGKKIIKKCSQSACTKRLICGASHINDSRPLIGQLTMRQNVWKAGCV